MALRCRTCCGLTKSWVLQPGLVGVVPLRRLVCIGRGVVHDRCSHTALRIGWSVDRGGWRLASRFACASFSCHLLKSRAWAMGGSEGLPVRGRPSAAEILDTNHLVEFLVEHDLDYLGQAAFGQSPTQGTLLAK